RSIFLKYILEIETILKSLLAEVISSRYGIKDYLVISNYDTNLPDNILNDSIDKINDEINKQNGKHEAVTHYITKYGYLPPFVLTKILTFGELSRYYSILTQSDKQYISKEFKLSDKVLKQIIQNMTMVRNICAHNDRLFSFHSKFLISFKYINNKYSTKDKSTNLYMIKESMKYMLDDAKKQEFENEINKQIDKLKDNINSIEIKTILNLMGYPNE
ncbi:MAG: Abi family protein, partial [bacterium]|nr:Abi family protein [bacterium]